MRPDHRLSDELRTISQILDENPEILDLVLQDLSDKGDPQNGSPGLGDTITSRYDLLRKLLQGEMEPWAKDL